jgi:3-deoxy-manno-octulosonate cytidylyltransferase (CMP-KDO synthetase)
MLNQNTLANTSNEGLPEIESDLLESQKKVRTVIGIPARMGSTRFPGKPLCKILGMPMIEHVYKRCALTQNHTEVFVATCDNIIKKTVEGFEGKAVMTPESIERPALRVAEACKTLGLYDDDIIAVVQGDEPLINPEMIDKGINELLDHPEYLCTNLCADMTESEWLDKDEVKVVTNLEGHATYMSRSPIPSKTIGLIGPRIKQLGIFFFRLKSLLLFQNLEKTPLEVSEAVEMLRAIEHGHIIKMVKIDSPCTSVDNPDQRDLVEALMREDPFWPQYSNK